MPNSVSAKKRLRQSLSRRLHNRSIRSRLRTMIRKVREAITAGDAEAGKTAFQAAVKALDQAAAKNVVHPNKAARIKSRLSRTLKGAQPAKG